MRGVITSLLSMIKGGVTHLAVATDHVIESFRNDLWPGYKTGEGIEPDLWAQFPLLEEAVSTAGIVVWPMIEFEADDTEENSHDLETLFPPKQDYTRTLIDSVPYIPRPGGKRVRQPRVADPSVGLGNLQTATLNERAAG